MLDAAGTTHKNTGPEIVPLWLLDLEGLLESRLLAITILGCITLVLRLLLLRRRRARWRLVVLLLLSIWLSVLLLTVRLLLSIWRLLTIGWLLLAAVVIGGLTPMLVVCHCWGLFAVQRDPLNEICESDGSQMCSRLELGMARRPTNAVAAHALLEKKSSLKIAKGVFAGKYFLGRGVSIGNVVVADQFHLALGSPSWSWHVCVAE
jgi:hypothetical protein